MKILDMAVKRHRVKNVENCGEAKKNKYQSLGNNFNSHFIFGLHNFYKIMSICKKKLVRDWNNDIDKQIMKINNIFTIISIFSRKVCLVKKFLFFTIIHGSSTISQLRSYIHIFTVHT